MVSAFSSLARIMARAGPVVVKLMMPSTMIVRVKDFILYSFHFAAMLAVASHINRP
jgi:hypothetical protein